MSQPATRRHMNRLPATQTNGWNRSSRQRRPPSQSPRKMKQPPGPPNGPGKKTIAATNPATEEVKAPPKRRRHASPTTLLETPPPTRFQAPATKAAASTATAEVADRYQGGTSAVVADYAPLLSGKTKAPTAAETDNSGSPSASSRPAAVEASKKSSLMVSLFDDDTSVDLSQNSSSASATTVPTKSLRNVQQNVRWHPNWHHLKSPRQRPHAKGGASLTLLPRSGFSKTTRMLTIMMKKKMEMMIIE